MVWYAVVEGKVGVRESMLPRAIRGRGRVQHRRRDVEVAEWRDLRGRRDWIFVRAGQGRDPLVNIDMEAMDQGLLT